MVDGCWLSVSWTTSSNKVEMFGCGEMRRYSIIQYWYERQKVPAVPPVVNFLPQHFILSNIERHKDGTLSDFFERN